MPKIHGSDYLLLIWNSIGRKNLLTPFSIADINEFNPELSTWDKVTIKKMSESYFHYLPLFNNDCYAPYLTDEEAEKVEDEKARSVINSWKA